MKDRKYHIIAINECTGKKVYMTGYPATHQEACTMLSKLSKHPARRVRLEEAPTAQTLDINRS